MIRFIRKIFGKVSDYIEMKLRKLCYGMSLDTKFIIAACIIIISAVGSLFVFATAVYQVGKYKARQEMEIKHIAAPELLIKSNKNLKPEDHEKDR